MKLSAADIRTLAHFLSPEYVIPAATEHGDGDPVMGAMRAYVEVRDLIRNYARFVEQREGGPRSGTGLVMALRAMGYAGRFQPLRHFPLTPWRQTALEIWAEVAPIPGFVDVRIPEGWVQADLERAVIGTVSKMLAREPRLNVALLRGRIYQRTTPEVMVHFELGPDAVRSIVVDSSKLDDHGLKMKLRRALRGLLRAGRHDLADIGEQLLRAWLKEGLIASHAGATVSPVGSVGVDMGHACLVPGNGIPLAITVGRIRESKATIGVLADHRCFDGRHAGMVYQTLREEVPKWH